MSMTSFTVAMTTNTIWNIEYDADKWLSRFYSKFETYSVQDGRGQPVALDTHSRGFVEQLIGEHRRNGRVPERFTP